MMWLPRPLIAILLNNHMQPRARARHADVGDAAVPVGFDVGDAGYDDDVVLQAIEAGDGGPGDVFERGAAELGDVVFGEAAEGHAFEVFVFFGARGLYQEERDAGRGDVVGA